MAALPALGVGVFAALRESLATVVTYAYSRRELSSQWVDSPFLETAQQQAERACIEMAALGRALVWVQPAPKMSKEYIKREGTSPECAPIGWIDTTSGVRADLTALEASTPQVSTGVSMAAETHCLCAIVRKRSRHSTSGCGPRYGLLISSNGGRGDLCNRDSC
jgi:hypothetical protein